MSTLTTKEAETLHQMVLNNHFISGCVTELIADLQDLSTSKHQNQCGADFDKTLSYVQWVETYHSCMAK